METTRILGRCCRLISVIYRRLQLQTFLFTRPYNQLHGSFNFHAVLHCFILPLSCNMGTLTSWNPLGHSSGPGSSVGIATELRAGPSWIESRWGRDFPPVQTGPGAHPASCKMGTGSFPGVKVLPGRAADHSPLCSAAVMEQ